MRWSFVFFQYNGDTGSRRRTRNLRLNRGSTIVHTKNLNLALNLRLNWGFTIIHTKILAVNFRLNLGFTILHAKNLAVNIMGDKLLLNFGAKFQR